MKILIVENHGSLRRLYKEELEDEGYEVVTASTGEEGIALFESEKPDLVTLDLCSSRIDEGLHVLRQMKHLSPAVPVVIHSAFDCTDDQSWDADAYVTKSSDLSDLKTAIRETQSALNPFSY